MVLNLVPGFKVSVADVGTLRCASKVRGFELTFEIRLGIDDWRFPALVPSAVC